MQLNKQLFPQHKLNYETGSWGAGHTHGFQVNTTSLQIFGKFNIYEILLQE